MYDAKFMLKSEKYIKKTKDKNLKEKFKNAIQEIQKNPYIGEAKKGDLTTIYGFDVYYNKTNYEISYKIFPKKYNCYYSNWNTRKFL